ncbi:unnamed protein product [Alternaria alternata]|uniref:DUF1446-domain-containing protein n=1 Tax=Alternaria alternata TaxID=5599 RepID=A0A4Q4N6W9_ALTAL|nr:DUF1446-like protein [Alternaria alternata]RYN54100.1 hypothetical protein AA0118_g9387 [Alternaria tenuissima]RYN71556.1 hypothetical protein AA0117_g9349 [Alternaria alternata]
MSPSTDRKRAVRIAGCSGGFTDRSLAITRMAGDPEVDVVMGDWLSEMTMTVHGSGKVKQKSTKSNNGTMSLEERKKSAMYADTFIQCFEPAVPNLVKNKTKLAVNAGASDTELLAEVVVDILEKQGASHLKVAWIEGDDVTGQVNSLIKKGEKFESLMHGKKLEEWGMEPVCAQAYLGGLCIAEAFRQGADIVLAGRVADAAPVIGAAAWWHDWKNDQFDELAGALIAGHLVECSAYVTGGYYSMFKDLMKTGKHINMGFPIAEVEYDGSFNIAKEKDTGGCVTVGTCTSQLLYEIQGPLYYNCDVTADITDVKMEQVGEDLVRVTGVKGFPPPPTTKVGITAPAGWQCEWHMFVCGLDIEEKCKITEDQIRYAMGDNVNRFKTLRFHQNGSSPIDAHNQDVATVDFRIFAQTSDPELVRPDVPNGFNRWCLEVFLQSAPGLSLSNDLRQIAPKPYYDYWVSLLPQDQLPLRVHAMYGDRTVTNLSPPKVTKEYPRQQASYETSSPVDLSSFGETVRAPLGYIVAGRSGDKASDCNCGFFVRYDDEWNWLRSFMTIERVKELLGKHEYGGKPIDRFEIAGIRSVHFLLHDHLRDGGYNTCSSYDTLGKNAMEYMRAKTVDLPKKFLDRGRI